MVFKEDIYGRRKDGRRYLIVSAGVPITDSRARQLGIVPFRPGEPDPDKLPKPSAPDPGQLPKPGEIKDPETDPETADEETPTNATPGAIKLADQHDIDLRGLVGTGKGGRVIVHDVRKLIAASS